MADHGSTPAVAEGYGAPRSLALPILSLISQIQLSEFQLLP
jgi:hypothetical protein